MDGRDVKLELLKLFVLHTGSDDWRWGYDELRFIA